MTSQIRLRFIDTWRAIAVTMVIAAHLGQNTDFARKLNEIGGSFVTSYGLLGVFIFFFISGYVVSQTALREVTKNNTISLSGFYIRRLYRIAPPLLIYLTTCLILDKAGVIFFPLSEFIGSALYLCNSTQQLAPCGWYAGHTWSLAFEEQFYLLFPGIFAAIELGRRIHPAAVLTAVLAIIPFFLPIPWVGKTGFIIIYTLFWMGYLFAKHEHILVRTLTRSPAAILISACLITFFPVGAFDSIALGKYYKFSYIISIPMMIMASSLPSGIIGKFFNNKPIAYIGRISYSIYLWQQLATSPLFHESSLAVQFSAIALVIFFCAASFHLIEKPLIDIGRRRSMTSRWF